MTEPLGLTARLRNVRPEAAAIRNARKFMKTHTALRRWALAPLMLAPLVPLRAADSDAASRVRLEEPNDNRNRFSISYAAGWNIDAKFSGVGRRVGPNGQGGPGPAKGSGVNRFYDDGYDGVSSFSPNGKYGLTYFWGFDHASQVMLESDTLALHSSSVRPATLKDADGDPQHGFQVTFNREICRDADDRWRWGFEAAFGWNDVQIDDHRPVHTGTRLITDSYNLGGVVPEGSSYHGSYSGPGPLIDDAPSHRDIVSTPNGGLVTGQRQFDADLYVFHVGPYFEFPIVEKLRGVLSGGFALGVMDGRLRINERATISGGAPMALRGANENTDVLYGGYVSATLHYALTEQWDVFAGGQLQSLTDYSVEAAGHKATIDQTLTPYILAGISFSF